MFSCLQKVLVLLVLNVFASSLMAKDYEQGNYPRFSHAKLFSTGESVSGKPNVVLSAIENSNVINLISTREILSAKRHLFPVERFESSYTIDKLATPAFVGAMTGVVTEYACAEYRFRNSLPESDSCNGYVPDTRKREAMPFVSGQYVSSRIESHVDDKKNGTSFTTYLTSSSERPLSSAFGSIHELGTFFGRLADNRSLILSVNLQAYWLGEDNRRQDLINEKPEVYFVILPRAIDIANQQNQRSAAKFAVEHARLLVIRSN